MLKGTGQRFSARHSGFTLVELMIVVVVASILIAIAVPSYQYEVQKSRRTDARNAILDIAAREERYLSVANSYSAVPTDVGYLGATWPQTVTNGYYSVTVTTPDLAYIAAGGLGPSYVVTAQAIGLQANDTACASFSVTQIGKQTALTAALVDNSTTCWGI
jgi:type IV pilus assembly protein PilE